MSIQVKHSVLLQISRDADGKKKLFYPDTNDVIHSGFDNQTNGSLTIAATSSESLSFGDVTDVRGILIELSGDALVRLNGGTDDIPMTLAPSATKCQFFLEGDLNAVVIENEGATVITGVFCVWGDLSA